MKKRLSFTLMGILLIVAVLLPFIAVGICTFAIPAQYDLSFLGALTDKYERLYSIEEPKIVIVGGSSTAFGLNSEMLSEHMGMPVVNFGLYATLGTKIMLDLSEDAINEGDIIIVAPETDKQTLSLYFNAQSVWQAFDGNFSMLKHVKSEDASDMVGEVFNFAASKLGYALSSKPDPQGVYHHSSFNEYGDIIYERPGNVMRLGYDPNMIVDFSTSMFDEAFIDYLNCYIELAESRGAKVFYSFPPINASAVDSSVTDETLFNYYDFISKNINCPVISDINNYIIEENYFYDSNFHLNDAGVVLRTATLIKELNVALGITKVVDIEIPEAPPRQDSGSSSGEGDNSYAELFSYDAFDNGLVITGILPEKLEEAKGIRNITIPSEYDGKPVLAIAENGLSGLDELRQLTINDNIVQFFNGAFAGCPALEKIIMNHKAPGDALVGDQLFNGASETAKLYYSTEEIMHSFVADYFWGVYADRTAK